MVAGEDLGGGGGGGVPGAQCTLPQENINE